METKVEKWKNKKWFNIYAPKILGGEVIGEMPANTDKDGIGRVIKVSLSWLTKNPSHSFMTVGLRVSSIDGNSAQTNLNYLEQTYSYIHSLVRRYNSAIYTVDSLKDKEGKALTLKLLVVTRNKTASPKKTAIRKTLSEFSRGYIASKSSDEFIKSVIDGSFQMDAIGKIKNIAPISKLEVKKIEL